MIRLNFILLVLVIACALGVITSQHQARKRFIELDSEQAAAKKLADEWTQLQLEQSTWATHKRVETVASRQLGMRFAEPGKLKRLVDESGFRDTSERVLSVAANWRGSPEHLLSSMLEIAAPFRRVLQTLSDDERMAAVQEVYSNLNPRFDGVHTHTRAPIVIVSGIK